MKRAAQERQRVLSLWQTHLNYQHREESNLCRCEYQPGRFRKTERVGGCRKARCYLCHADKLFKRPTPQQRRANIDFREQLQEVLSAA